MTPEKTTPRERYTIQDELGRGRASIVYRALDRVNNRTVALKVLLDGGGDERIRQLCALRDVLARLAHPNLIRIEGVGELVEDGFRKPFLILPLLEGPTFARLRSGRTQAVSVRNATRQIGQVCLAVQAAHEKGLVHGNLTPDNIFVDGDLVTVAGLGSALIPASTPSEHLAPEQIDGLAATALTDQFAIAAIAYLVLTRVKPFAGASIAELSEAIRRQNPPPIGDWNPKATLAVSQVIRKAMAKRPRHRFASVLEFHQALQTAVRKGTPAEFSDRTRIVPRMLRTIRCFESGDLAFASETLAEVEGEGYLDEEILALRRQIDQALRRHRRRNLMISARDSFSLSDYPQALRMVQEAVDLDPQDGEAAALRMQIEKESGEEQVLALMAQAGKQVQGQEFEAARFTLDEILRLRPQHAEALSLQASIPGLIDALKKTGQEKEWIYDSAVEAWQQGDITAALERMNLLLAMDQNHPDSSRSASYRSFHDQLRQEQEVLAKAYETAKDKLAAGDMAGALEDSRHYLKKYPNYTGFRVLQGEAEERLQRSQAHFVDECLDKAAQEPDLDRAVAMLEQALRTQPAQAEDQRIKRLLLQLSEKRELLRSLETKARSLEGQSKYSEALDQWQILASIHEAQPGVAGEMRRLMQLRDQQARESGRERILERVRGLLEKGDRPAARRAIEKGLVEFPADSALLQFDRQVRNMAELEAHAAAAAAASPAPDPFVTWCLAQARRLQAAGDSAGALAIVGQGLALAPGDTGLRQFEADLRRGPTGSPVVAKKRQPRITALLETPEPAPQTPPPPANRGGRTPTIAAGLARRAFPVPPTPEASQAIASPAAANPAAANKALPGKLALWAGAILVVVAAALLVWHSLEPASPKPVPAPPTVKLAFHTSPPGAKITVDGSSCGTTDCTLALPPGKHQAKAELPGFGPAVSSFLLTAGAVPSDITLSLSPVLTPLTVMTDRDHTTVFVDGIASASLPSGMSDAAQLQPGLHQLRIESGNARVTFEAEIVPGSALSLTKGLEVQAGRAIVLTCVGSKARVYGAAPGVSVAFDGKPAGVLASAALEIRDLSAGPHELQLSGPRPGERTKFTFQAGSPAAIVVSLSSR